jgi:hypothetical protein
LSFPFYSDQVWPNWYQASRRLIDPNRLPIQTGATLTIEQQDAEVGREVDLFPVTDALPAAVKIQVHIAYGITEGMFAAVDSLPGAGALDDGRFAWDFNASNTLPSRLQVHNNGSDVCVSHVELLLRNQTGFEHVAVSIPTKIFQGCW